MNQKPKYSMDLLPSPDTFGWGGFIYFIISAIVIIWTVLYTGDFLVMGVTIFIFILGGFSGREFEKIHWMNQNKKLKEDNEVLNNRLKELVDEND